MNKLIKKLYGTLILVFAFSLFSSCDNDPDNQQDSVNSNAVCTKWGASDVDVMNYMKNYEINTVEYDFMCFDGKNNVKTISYQFQDGMLHAAVVIIPEEDTTIEDLHSTFKGYEYLGERNGVDIFIKESANTIVTIARKTWIYESYYAIGYTALDSESLN